MMWSDPSLLLRKMKQMDEEVELTLGLSMGGRFGVDRATIIPRPLSGKRLTKSSSIAGIMPLPVEIQGSFDAEEAAVAVLVKRGDGKTLRPVLMRTTSLPVEREDEDWRKRKENQSLRRMEAKRRRSEKLKGYGSLGEIAGGEVPMEEVVAAADPNKTEREHKCMDSRGKEIGRSAMEELPCVSTNGEGPNGRRVEGILYKYGKGEEVKIMCVCHGSLLSPAEFVRHAGGAEVANPLRHIVVNPLP